MNQLLSFFERQQGISNDLNIDFALKRLCVYKEDSWKGITPSTYSSDYNPYPPIFSAKFANHKNYKHILAIANEDGKIALQDTTKRNIEPEEKALEGTQCHYNAVFDLEWAPGQLKFVSGSGDHTARLWDITESEIKENCVFSGHSRSVKTIAFRHNDPAVFASGGRDGAILIWDTRAMQNVELPRADNCILSGHAGGPGTPVSQRKKTARTPKLCTNTTSNSSITGLVFQNDTTLISCGAGDGVIKVWDLRRNYTCYKKEPLPKYSLPYAGTSTLKGFTNLLIDKSGVKLYANCMDHTIYCYNLSSYSTNPMQRYTGHKSNTFYIKSCLSPDGNYLLSGSSDEKAYIWNLKNPEPLIALNGHTVEVTCVAWGESNEMPIVTCSDDARHKIWRIGPEVPESDKNLYRGHTEACTEFKHTYCLRTRLKALESTPRSLKRIVEENEKTPSSAEKVPTKRTFTEMAGESLHWFGSESKRSKSIETRGRRLFGPSTSKSALQQLSADEDKRNMPSTSAVLHGSEDSNQENSIKPNESNGFCQPSSSGKPSSPLTERIDDNANMFSPPSSSRAFASTSATIFSPTSNLPNFVLDGEAPHLGIMSPKRKVKEKVDWLTKIRKQKLMSGRIPLNDKLNGNSEATVSTNGTDDNMCLMSPRLQSLRTAECSPRSHSSPRRRTSHSAINSDASPSASGTSSQPKTPTSSRRNSENSILRFLTTTNAASSASSHHTELNPSLPSASASLSSSTMPIPSSVGSTSGNH